MISDQLLQITIFRTLELRNIGEANETNRQNKQIKSNFSGMLPLGIIQKEYKGYLALSPT